MKGRRRLSRVHMRSLDWPIKGWMITPVTGAASQRIASESALRPDNYRWCSRSPSAIPTQTEFRESRSSCSRLARMIELVFAWT
jgi:hypothetical protein